MKRIVNTVWVVVWVSPVDGTVEEVEVFATENAATLGKYRWMSWTNEMVEGKVFRRSFDEES